jgi:predicted aspartyl protease
MYQVGDLKVQVTRNRAMLQGEVNGQPVRVLIDTGADNSLLFRARAQTLHVPLTDLPGVKMAGVGGMSQGQLAHLDQLQIAGAVRRGFNMLVAGEGRAADFDILLGEDFLGRFDIEFDLKHDAVRLLQPRGCGETDMAYWAAEYNETPIVEDHNNHIGIIVKLNGRPVHALLDSGAATSVATLRAASNAQVKLEGSTLKGRGLGALTLSNEVGVLDSFTIGGETITNTKLRFSDLFGATTYERTGSLIAQHGMYEPEMLLGFDFLRSHRVLISRSRHMVYFTYEGGPVFETTRRPPTPPPPTAPSLPADAPPATGATPPQAAASRSPAGS